jgi:queuine/archaeosine tRNA-ribosyltransferase
MYVKVQRGATIKKLKIDGPEKATLEQLFRPFRNMNLKGEDIQTEHYCLALINKNLDADIIIHSD